MIYIVAPFETENFSKGISSRNLEMAKVLGEKVVMLCSSYDHRYKKFNDMDQVKSFLAAEMPALTLVEMKTTRYRHNVSLARVLSNCLFALSTAAYLLRNSTRSDVVIINSIPPELFFLVSWVARIRRLRLVVDVRDVWPDALSVRRGTLQRMFSLYCNFLYRASSRRNVVRILYVANTFKDWVHEKGLDHIPSFFMPLGYDKNRWRGSLSEHENPAIAQRVKVSAQSIRLIYIGYLSQQFDLTSVLCAVNASENVELHVIGGGEKIDKYKTLACDRVYFYGMQPPANIPLLVHDIAPSLAVLPLASGGTAFMPNKLFDYIALRLPALVINNPEAGEFVVDRGIGWSIAAGSHLDVKVFLDNLSMNDVDAFHANVAGKSEGLSMQALYANLPSILSDSLSEAEGGGGTLC